MAKRGPLEVIEGFYIAQIVHHFYQQGVFERLAPERSGSEVAAEFGYDQKVFGALLNFLYQTTNLLILTRSGNYSLKKRFREYYFLGFQLDKFIGAYGPTLVNLDRSLKSETLGRRFIDRRVQALAYRKIGSPPHPLVLSTVRRLKIRSLLDLGCGPATLLTELCSKDPTFQAWGIDQSREMCEVARTRVAEAGLGHRIRIINADARNLGTYLRPRVRAGIQALQSKGLLNELFGHGDKRAVDYLRKLKRLFPGRLLFVVDYYGKLTRVPRIPAKYRHTMIHDVIQVVTDQGVPPADLRGWMAVYFAANCSLERAYEGDDQGVEWFVHVVRL